MSILSWILVGLIAGWLAGVVMRGGGYGVLGDIIVGIVGALVGGFLATNLFGVPGAVDGFNLKYHSGFPRRCDHDRHSACYKSWWQPRVIFPIAMNGK